LIGTTLYTLDLNTSKLVVYGKNLSSFTWVDGKGYLFSKDATGQPIVKTDNNLFDEKPAEQQSWILPTAKHHQILAERDDWWLLQTDNGTSQGLWLIAQPAVTNKTQPSNNQVMLSGDVRGVTIDYDKKQLTYISGQRLVLYDIASRSEKTLRDFGKTLTTLVGRRNNSLFVQTAQTVAIVSPTGENYYELATGKPTLLISDDSRKFWMMDQAALTEWVVRRNPGLFGMLSKLQQPS